MMEMNRRSFISKLTKNGAMVKLADTPSKTVAHCGIMKQKKR